MRAVFVSLSFLIGQALAGVFVRLLLRRLLRFIKVTMFRSQAPPELPPLLVEALSRFNGRTMVLPRRLLTLVLVKLVSMLETKFNRY